MKRKTTLNQVQLAWSLVDGDKQKDKSDKWQGEKKEITWELMR